MSFPSDPQDANKGGDTLDRMGNEGLFFFFFFFFG